MNEMTCPVRLLVLPLPLPTANVILRVCKFCFSSIARRPSSLETLTVNTEACQLSQNLHRPYHSKSGMNGKLQGSCSRFQSKALFDQSGKLKTTKCGQGEHVLEMLQLQNEPLKKKK